MSMKRWGRSPIAVYLFFICVLPVVLLKTRNLTSLFRFKAFLFQRVRPLVNVAPLQLGEKEGLSLISCRQAEFREQGVMARIVAQTAQHRIDQQA